VRCRLSCRTTTIWLGVMNFKSTAHNQSVRLARGTIRSRTKCLAQLQSEPFWLFLSDVAMGRIKFDERDLGCSLKGTADLISGGQLNGFTVVRADGAKKRGRELHASKLASMARCDMKHRAHSLYLHRYWAKRCRSRNKRVRMNLRQLA